MELHRDRPQDTDAVVCVDLRNGVGDQIRELDDVVHPSNDQKSAHSPTSQSVNQSIDRHLHGEIGLRDHIRPAGISRRRKPLQARRQTHGNKEILKERDDDDGDEEARRAAELFLRDVLEVAVLEVVGRQETSGCQEEGPDPEVGEDDASDEDVQPLLGFRVVGGGAVAFDYEGPEGGKKG